MRTTPNVGRRPNTKKAPNLLQPLLNALDTITRTVIAMATIAVVAVSLVAGTEAGIGAAWGAGLATANWLALRWVMRQVATGSNQKKSALMVLLVLKMGLLGLICWVLVAQWKVHPVGFVIALGTMVPAIFIGMMLSRGASSDPSEPPALDDEAPSEMRSSHAPR